MADASGCTAARGRKGQPYRSGAGLSDRASEGQGDLRQRSSRRYANRSEPPPRRLAPYHTVGFQPGEEIAARLESLGVAPSKIDFIINSHLHFDHCGGNQQLPNATLLIQRREWEAGHNADLIESVFYDPHDYDHGHRVKMIDGEHDVFGDGSVVCIPTPGHTPGHQSLRVRIGADEVVMTGDACYLRRTLDNFHLPTAMYDREQMLESIRRLRALRDGGAMIITGHDPDLWKTIPQAPDRLVAVRPGG